MNAISRRRSPALLLACLALLAACKAEPPPKTARIQDALPGMPLPGDPTFVSRSGSEDALQVVLTSAQAPDSIVAYYRQILSKTPWTLVSDQAFNTSGRVFYATRNGPPIWVTVIPNPKGAGTQISLNGAVVQTSKDSAAARDTVKAKPVPGPFKKPAPKAAPTN